MDIKDLSPFFPSVDVSGICNLKCIACPRGDSMRIKNGGFMNSVQYQMVIKKLLKEIPFLTNIDLYMFGEPLLNPELPEIIKIGNALGISSGISTNLNYSKNLEAVVRAGPAHIKISCSGYGKQNYEITHTGAKWETFYQNILSLSKFKENLGVETLITVLFHVNKKNVSEYKDIYNLCKNLGFGLQAILSYIFPDYMMDYLENKELCKEVLASKDLMIIGIDDLLKDREKEKTMRCNISRSFPNIGWDMSVMTCCNYSKEKLADNYLEAPLNEIIDRHNTSSFCAKCINHALHRWEHLDYYQKRLDDLIYQDCKLPSYI
jgi:MoaA/NifB/PqqE/SkfB family radical SAM enzyme